MSNHIFLYCVASMSPRAIQHTRFINVSCIQVMSDFARIETFTEPVRSIQ